MSAAPNVASMLQMSEVAIGLSLDGYKVFPLRPGRKLPLHKGWQASATANTLVVRDTWPGDQYAPGILTSDLVVIDVEAAGIGVDDAALGLPRTRTHHTAGKGKHFVYRAPPGMAFANSCKKIGPHVDVRARGGLIVGPGGYAIDPNGVTGWYSVADAHPIVQLPPHLIEKISAAPEKLKNAGKVLCDLDTPWALDRAQAYLTDASDKGAPRAVLEGSRNDAAFKVACRLGDFAVAPETAFDLLQSWNLSHCLPAMDEDELAAIIDSSYEHRRDAVGCAHPLVHFAEVAQPLAADALPGPICVSSLAGRQVPEREWHAPGVPAFTVTGLFGDGATGKSLLGAQMGIATALAKPWVGKEIRRPGPVLFVGAEDDQDEMHRRFAEIAAKYGATLEDLKQLHLWCLAGEDAVLGAANSNGIVQPTNLWKRVSEFIGDVKPTLVIYDTLSDLFAGNENNRGQAMQFTKQLRRPALQTRGSALLLAHPSVAGMASGTGLSGSTGWNNAVRARMYFSRIQGEGGREVDPDARTLQMKKANYGPTGETVNLYWEDGVFVPDSGKPERLRTAREAQAESVFLGLLGAFNAQGRSVSNAKASTYAPAVFFKEPAAQSLSKADFEGAMSSLFTKNLIRIETTGPESRRRSRLVRT